MSYRQRGPARRLPGALLALLALLWYGIAKDLAQRAATGLASHLWAGVLVPLLGPVFLLFLLFLGLTLLDGARRPASDLRLAAGLPERPTAAREWGIGAAVGWAAAILATLPLVLSGHLLLSFWIGASGWLAALAGIAGAALATLASEIAFRGYGFRRLSETMGKTAAALLIAFIYALVVGLPFGNARTVVIAFLFSLLLTTGWLRTHAIWLSWGLHFVWNLCLGLLFGLPTLDGGDLASVVLAQVHGRSHWLGGTAGPVSGWWSVPVLLAAVLVLVAVTRELAWRYTHAPIVPAGYPMDVKPPAAHAAMEPQAPAPPPPLVQILPAPSNPPPPRSSPNGV